MNNEIVKFENGELVIDQAFAKNFHDLCVAKAKFDVMQDTLKNLMLENMEKYSIKSFENDDLKITYVPESTRTSVDTKALKDDGLYELYTKTSPVKASVRVTIK